jgi:SNF2 family DNA or RNA helicase
MKIIDDRALSLRLRDPDRVTHAIKKSVNLGPGPDGLHEVVVHWGLKEVQTLSELGFHEVMAPMKRDYSWPGFLTPMEHQRVTAAFLVAHKRAYCLSEQGTGKTVAAAWAADYLMSKGLVRRVLILCPKSIMHESWLNTLARNLMHRTAAICHGPREVRKKVVQGDYEFVVLNYDGVHMVQKELAGNFDLVIVDEANYLKTTSTRRWKAVDAIVSGNTRIWMMTGTPAAQSPLDAYGLARLCTPNRVPKFFGSWRDRVMLKVSQFRWMPKGDATEQVQRALQPAIRFTKAECIDLPPLTYQTRYVPLTPQQEAYYKQMRKEMLLNLDSVQITAAHAAAGMNKLLQLSCGAVYADNGEIVDFDSSNRIQELLEVVEQAAHKVIVFVPFRHAIEKIAEVLTRAGVTCDIINGSVSMTARTRIFRAFQEDDDPRVLVVQPQSASHGVTLTAADTIVWYGPVSSVETWLQANERINRPSQQNKMTVIKIFGSAVEKRVYDALESKELDQRKLVTMYEQVLKQGD